MTKNLKTTKTFFGLQTHNPLSGSRAISIHNVLFIWLSLFYFVFAFHLYQATKGIPGFTLTNVDEFYFTYLPAFNFFHFGPLNSCFLPDFASGLDPAAHPYVYTHNIAFPNWIVYALMQLGITKIEHFSLISIFLSYSGYLAGYLFIRKYVGPGAALVLFFMILSDYQEVLTHSLSFFRAFQWILFFSIPYLFFQWSQRSESRMRTLLLFFSLLLIVCYEYTLALQIYFILIFLYFFNVNECRNLASLKKLLLIMFTAFIIPKSFQMLMVWWMFGSEMAFYDHVATLANRLLPMKDPQEMADLYSEKGILFWVYGDKPGLLKGIRKLLKSITTVYGVIPVACALAVICFHMCPIFKKLKKLCTWNNDLVWRIPLHVGLYSLAMILAYNGYKEVSSGYDHILSHFTGRSMEFPELPEVISNYIDPELPQAIRHSIKGTFPWAILAFTASYLFQVFRRKKQDFQFSFQDYAMVVFYSACVINAVFILRNEALIVLNVSFLLFLVPLFVLQTVKRLHFITFFKNIKKLYKQGAFRIEQETLITPNYITIVSCMIMSFLLYNVLFYYHTYEVNIGSRVPLIELYTISATGLMVYLVWRFIIVVTKSAYIRVFFIFAILFVQSYQFVKTYHRNPPLPMAAYDILPKYEGKSFVTSYHSIYPTIFTKQWTIPNWNNPITPENVSQSGYIWLKDKNSPEGQKYSSPEYLLYTNRLRAPLIDIRIKDTFEIVEQGDNYEIYKLR